MIFDSLLQRLQRTSAEESTQFDKLAFNHAPRSVMWPDAPPSVFHPALYQPAGCRFSEPQALAVGFAVSNGSLRAHD